MCVDNRKIMVKGCDMTTMIFACADNRRIVVIGCVKTTRIFICNNNSCTINKQIEKIC